MSPAARDLGGEGLSKALSLRGGSWHVAVPGVEATCHWNGAPGGLATRRQLRELGLCPGLIVARLMARAAGDRGTLAGIAQANGGLYRAYAGQRLGFR